MSLLPSFHRMYFPTSSMLLSKGINANEDRIESRFISGFARYGREELVICSLRGGMENK